MLFSLFSIGLSMSFFLTASGVGREVSNHLEWSGAPIHTWNTTNLHSWRKHSGEMITLTFDDGPHRLYTPKILDILQVHDIPATFFVLGNRIVKNEKILERMAKAGYEVGNHSYIHPQFSRISTFRYIFEVWRTGIMIWSTTGKYPLFFRFPYGDEDRRIGSFHHGPIIGWNVDANDWKEKNPKRLAKNIMRQTQSGSIILLHDIREDTLNALPSIIESLEWEGYTFVPLRELIHYDASRDSTNIHYRGATASGWVTDRIIKTKITPSANGSSNMHDMKILAS